MLVVRWSWQAESHLTFRDHTADEIIDHYLTVIADGLDRDAPPKGHDELEPYLHGWLPLPGR